MDEKQAEPIEVTFYLKSGQSFTVPMIRLTRKLNGLGHFVGLEWENVPKTPGQFVSDLSYINIDDVSAIVVTR